MFTWLKTILSKKKPDHQVDFAFLKEVPLFKKLTERELTRITDLFIYKSFKADELIFGDGYPHIVLYIVVEGKVKQYKDSHDFEYLISDIYPKMMFGGVAVFVETNRLVSATATEDTRLIAINKNDLMAFIKSNPATGIKLLWNLGKYLSTDFLRELEALKEYETKK